MRDVGRSVFPQVTGVPIVCALLFLEEAGLPLPVAPGDAVLVASGILVASGAVPVWVMAPLAYLAVIGGVLTGYTWAHRIGPKRVHALAARLHAAGPYDRAAARLRSATPLQIAASRLLPGLRVYTSLVAGAVDLNLGRFMIGVLPASGLWVVTFMGLGLFAGAPVERLFGRFDAYGLQAALVAVVVVIWLIAARWIPVAKPVATDARHSRWRLAVAFVIDLFAITCVAGALIVLTHIAGGDSDNVGFLAAIFAMLGVVYLVVARQTVGFTLGESMLDVRYRRPRRGRLHLPC